MSEEEFMIKIGRSGKHRTAYSITTGKEYEQEENIFKCGYCGKIERAYAVDYVRCDCRYRKEGNISGTSETWYDDDGRPLSKERRSGNIRKLKRSSLDVLEAHYNEGTT